jgi:NAD(P)-dependent dehydrogenase (short-subunit alcohol dehydrogenase family)
MRREHPVLIIGGTGGIGAALARRLSSAGRLVHLAARDQGRLEALADELGAGRTLCDALIETEVERAVADAAEASGGLAGLVYAVGSIDLVPLRRLDARRLADAFALNVTGAAIAARAAHGPLAAAGGAIVLFSSVAAGTGFRNHAVTGTVKAAVEGLTRALAAELAPKVRVNCVAPSLTRTPLAAALLGSRQVEEAIARQHPLGRIGEAEEVAAVAALLLGAETAFVTGQVIHVDGGRGVVAG